MKYKYFIYLIAALCIEPLTAQEQYYTETLKEFIAIQTLIAENRIDDFSRFTDDYSYIAAEKNIYVKLPKTTKNSPEGVFPFFYIDEGKNLTCGLTRKDSAGNFKLKLTKRELFQIWQELFKSMKPGLPYHMYKTWREFCENEDGEGRSEADWEDLGRYKLRMGNKNKKFPWKTYEASNFTTIWSTDQALIYHFLGPGKIDYIEIKFPKYEDKEWDEEVNVFFFINVNKMTFSNSPSNDNDPFNIPFFMSLKNFNDRIWADN